MNDLSRPYLALIVKLILPELYANADPPTSKEYLKIKVELWYDEMLTRLTKKMKFEEEESKKTTKIVKKRKEEVARPASPAAVQIIKKTPEKKEAPRTRPAVVDQPATTEEKKIIKPIPVPSLAVVPLPGTEVIVSDDKPAAPAPTPTPIPAFDVVSLSNKVKHLLESGTTQVKTIEELSIEFNTPRDQILSAARMMQKYSDIYLDESMGVLYLV